MLVLDNSPACSTLTHHYVYILRCSDGTLYTGYTTDPKRRLEQHNSGKASKYTRGRLPVTIAYLEGASTVGEALRREKEVKRMTRIQKNRLLSQSPLRIGPSYR